MDRWAMGICWLCEIPQGDGSITYGGGKANGNQFGNNMKILGAKAAQNPTERIQRQFQGRKKK